MSDMTIGGDINWKDFKKFRDQNTFVMVCGEVYPETIADFLEMQAESLRDSLRKILE